MLINPESMVMQNNLYLLRIIKSPSMFKSLMIPPEARRNEQYAKVVASPGNHLKGMFVVYEPGKGRSMDGDIRNTGEFLLVEKEHILALIEF